MFRQLRVLALVGMVLAIFTGTVSALQPSPMRVKVVIDEGTPAYYETNVETVRELLEEVGITIGPDDVLHIDSRSQIETGMVIEITRAITVKVRVDGAKDKDLIPIITLPKNLGNFALDYSRQTGVDYDYDKDVWYVMLTDGAVVDLTTKAPKIVTTVETIEDVQDIPFVTENVFNDNILEGETNVLSEGSVGKFRTVHTITYENGIEISRVITEEVVDAEPVARVIEIGTKLPEDVKIIADERFSFSEVRVMSATAYTSDYASTGKRPGDRGFGICFTGLKAQYGVVAVDPKVIPLYTKMYIDGYGYAIAGDTGGAIKGDKIDLYFDSKDVVRSFGRQSVTVYILEDQEKEYFTLK